jgi:hypothetical protein
MGMKVALVKSAVSRSISTAVASLREIFEDTFEDVVRDIGRWAKKTAGLYAIAAAVTVAALVALSHGLADLLAAAGLPGFAGHLTVAAAAGGTAYALVKAGSRRRISRDEAPDRRGLRVRIMVPRAAPARPGRRVYDVHRGTRGWEVAGPSSRHRTYSTKGRAVKAARRAARARPGRVVIHGEDGRIRRF